MLNYDLFRVVVAPEYKTMTDDDLDLFAEEAENEISLKVWGKFYERAVCLITAHLIAMSKKGESMGGNSATGQLLKTKVGDLERQFSSAGNGNKNDGTYALSTYGAEYLRLRKKLLITPVFVS